MHNDGHLPLLGGYDTPLVCEYCGVELEYNGDGIDRDLDSYAAADGSTCPENPAS